MSYMKEYLDNKVDELWKTGDYTYAEAYAEVTGMTVEEVLRDMPEDLANEMYE